MSDRLLVDHWYAHPVGHAIEALRYCLGYHRAAPATRIGLVLNSATPTELADLCPFVFTTYPVEHPFLDAPAYPDRPLAAVPRDWDWVVHDARSADPAQLAAFGGLARYYAAAREHFRACRGPGGPAGPEGLAGHGLSGHGLAGHGLGGHGLAGAAPPAYLPGQRLSLDLPAAARARADRLLAGAPVRIAVLPGGSRPGAFYPSASSWELVLRALVRQHPDAVVCIVGRRTRDARTSTGFGDFDRLRRAVPRAVGVLDAPIVDQLAAVAGCDVFVSPHSGFGMAALAVGTPWLTVSGNRWPEYFYNDVPFYSVLPDVDRFPCYSGLDPDPAPIPADTDGEGPRSPSMCAARIRADLPEIVAAAGLLIERRLSYQDAMAGHFGRLLRLYRGEASRIWSVDAAHEPYLDQ